MVFLFILGCTCAGVALGYILGTMEGALVEGVVFLGALVMGVVLGYLWRAGHR